MANRRRFAPRDWHALQEKAHLPEVQEAIRAAIVQGTIRVTPASGGGIIIIPMAAPPVRGLAALEEESFDEGGSLSEGRGGVTSISEREDSGGRRYQAGHLA